MGKTKKNKTQPEVPQEDPNSCFLCGVQDCQDKCTECGQISYCSEAHRLLHRPENLCFPFRVARKPDVGRYLVATRDIQPLELILYDRSQAYGPKMGSPSVCLQCLKPIDPLKWSPCPGCGWPMCAGEKCIGGKTHKMECPILAKGSKNLDFSNLKSPNSYYHSIAPLRLLLLRDACPESYARFQYLMDHNTERREDKELWNEYQKHVNDFLRNSCELSDRFSEEEVNRAVGLFWTNAFACNNGGGQAIFPTFSFISHSCISNANHVVFPNRHLALQAKVMIRKGDELTISYISSLQSTLRRRPKLSDKWFFSCTCPRCSSASECESYVSSLLCQARLMTNGCQGKKDDKLPVCLGTMSASEPLNQEGVWTCQRCPNNVRAQDVLQMENSIAKCLQEAVSASKPDEELLEHFQRLYEEHRVYLHQNHYLLTLLKRHIIVLSSERLKQLSLGELGKVKLLCEEVLSVLNIIDPGYNRERGVVLRHLSETNKQVGKKLLMDGRITQDQFTRQVHECMILFEESQKCMSMLVKK